ncbi:hybrid signal transduction histidine kinase M [Tanacetum coccineum]
MTNSEHPSPPPTLTLVEKLYAVHNINSLIPEKLDLAESNYSTWSYFFKGHCSNFGVLKHIEEPVTEASTSTPPMDEWITVYSIVKSWIFLTLSSTLRKRLIKANPKTAKAAWDAIETIFQDNKRTRTISLKGELRVIQMGNQTADEYFSKIEAILTLLTDLGLDMSHDDVVTYAINGLSDKYGSLAQIIAHKDPFPDLATVRSMVATEELRLRSRSSVLPTGTTSSAPQVLLAEASSRNQTGWNNKWNGDNRTISREVLSRNSNNFYNSYTTQGNFLHYACWILNLGQSRPTAPQASSLVNKSDPNSLQPTTAGLFSGYCYKLGKHVRLPFSLSETVVKSPFDIIHSNLWTSPLSGSPCAVMAALSLSDLYMDYASPSGLVSEICRMPARKYASELLERTGMLTLFDFTLGMIYLCCASRVVSNCMILEEPLSLLSRDLAIGAGCPLHCLLPSTFAFLCFSWQQSYLCGLSKRQVTFLAPVWKLGYQGVANAVLKLDAVIFTKGLPTVLFDEFRSSLSVRSSPAQTAGGC